MIQPDPRLLRPILRVRAAVLALLLVTYVVVWGLWGLAPEARQFWQFGGMAAVLGVQCLLSIVLYAALNRKNDGLLVHLSLLTDTVATTGLILCTGYAGSVVPLFYLLILLAAGLLYGLSTGIYYFLCISLANVAALVLDRFDPLVRHTPWQAQWAYAVMGMALPLVAFPLLLVFRLTQRGRYFEALYENISDGLFILDDRGRIVEANGRAAVMTGRNRNDLVGVALTDLIAIGQNGAVIHDQLHRCLAGAAVSFELLLDRRDSERLPVEISAQRVSGLSPGRIQAFARDISARRFMEAEIRRQNEELRQINQELQVGRDVALNASRLKSQFLANMSHELRTPLNSIIGYTQFVLEDRSRPLADDQREDLTRVLRAARHLLELINGVLDLARIESGRESVSISRCPLADLIDSVLDAVAPMAKGKGIRLACHIASDLPDLESDEKKLRQVLLNLLANAIKFTEHGAVEIDCRRDGADSVLIVVRDTGIGIPAEQLDEIFNEFHQVDPSIHKQYGGSGLGLAIVKRLVELLKGTIRVESTIGAGSTFSVSIPISLSRANESRDTSAAHEQGAAIFGDERESDVELADSPPSSDAVSTSSSGVPGA